MSIDFRIPVISSTAGSTSEGILRGTVAQTELSAVLANVQFAETIFAYRKDTTGGTFSFADVATEAASEVANSFEPWGNTAAMTAGDELYLACDHTVSEIYVDIDTPGVFTATGLEVAYSTDGVSAGAVATVTDASNAFRAVDGIYRIQVTSPGIVPFSPVPGSIPSRRWLVLRPAGLSGSVTTAPRLRRVWLRNSTASETWVDYAPVLNAPLADDSFGALETGTFFPYLGLSADIALPDRTYGLDTRVYQGVDPSMTFIWQYYANDGTWKDLPNLSDPTDGIRAGSGSPALPSAYTTPGVDASIRWTVPSDWSAVNLSHPGAADRTAYWIRFYLSSVTSFQPYPNVLWRLRCRAFGPGRATGVRVGEQTTLTQVAVGSLGTPPSTQTILALVNAMTGESANFTIPASASAPLNLNLSTSLVIGSTDELLLTHVSGGTMTDVELHLV